MNLKQYDNFNYSADQYAVQYLYEKETTIQNQLKQALDKARLSNEIIILFQIHFFTLAPSFIWRISKEPVFNST